MGDKVIPVKVALRIRPLVSKEKADACKECLRGVKNEPQVQVGDDNKRCFTYDYVFSQTSPQLEVYEQSVQPLLDALFKVNKKINQSLLNLLGIYKFILSYIRSSLIFCYTVYYFR